MIWFDVPGNQISLWLPFYFLFSTILWYGGIWELDPECMIEENDVTRNDADLTIRIAL